MISVHGEPVSFTVMKYNKIQTDVVTDVSEIFRKLDTSVQEASVIVSINGGEGL